MTQMSWKSALLPLFLAVAPLFGALSPCRAAPAIPPRPPNQEFIADYASLLPASARAQIAQYQQVAYERHDTPILVVTIGRMADYGGQGMTIEEFARAWFDAWGIGKQVEGRLINRGVLLLVSAGDRQARIELGAEWGAAWDTHCRRIMEGVLIANFKKQRFAEGITDTVGALAQMAEAGPEGAAPEPGKFQRFLDVSEELGAKRVKTSPFPGGVIFLMLVAGALLIAASFLFPEHRKILLWAGIALILIALFTWVILFILAIFLRAKGGRARSSGTFGGFRGGGFGGGFSGGGGASGRW